MCKTKSHFYPFHHHLPASHKTQNTKMSINLCNTFLHRNTPQPPLSMKQQQQQVTTNNKVPKWTCRKKDIHPEFHYDSKVYCSGEHVLTTGGTKKEYVVDVWSGNHPFYLGSRSANLIDADQVEKFRKKFGGLGGLDQLMQIPTLKGEIVIPPKRKPAGKGKKK